MIFGKKTAGGAEWLLVCLGNYGARYENTRHNIGFLAADRLVEKQDLRCNRLRFKALTEIIDFGGARVLLIAGGEDEAWPAELSVRTIEHQLKESGYKKEVKTLIFPHGSHLCGLMPNREREKKLYRMIPLVGLMYKTFGRYRKENLRYFAESEKEIINWVKES